MDKRSCVYTVLLGGYEALNEQPVARDSQIDFICFTDDRELSSLTWRHIYVEPVFPLDTPRSSRVLKICPHRFLKEYDVSLYIDNSIILKKTPEVVFRELFEGRNAEIACFKHNYRETVLDEFIEVAARQLDDLNTIQEQLNAYHVVDPEVLGERPYKSGFLLRAHNAPGLVETMEVWLAQVLRYSRRDQLSMNYAVRRGRPTMAVLETDFFNSEYFQWPVVSGRKPESYKRSALLTTLLMDRVAQHTQKIRDLSEELDELRGSPSWRVGQFLHRIRSALAPTGSLRGRMWESIQRRIAKGRASRLRSSR